MKKCPFCAEEIQNAAKKCRYCGEWLNKKTNISPIKSFVKSAKKLKKVKSSKELPMKWYWFTIYITWPLSIIISFLSIVTIKGYGLDITGYLYLALFQILLISVSCYGLYKKYHWSWESYIGTIAINSLINGFVSSDNSPIGFLVISTLLFSVYVYPQFVYFKKRKHLFINSTSTDKPKKKKIKKNVKGGGKQSKSETVGYTLVGVLLIGALLYLSIFQNPTKYIYYDIDVDENDNIYYRIGDGVLDYEDVVNGEIYQMINDSEVYMGKIKNGKIDGLFTWWFENGQKEEEGNYNNGETDGLETWWYENGQKWSETNYNNNGEIDGKWTSWYENGQKESEGYFKNGEPDGLATLWYENGQKEVEENIKNDKLIFRKCWDGDGNETECN